MWVGPAPCITRGMADVAERAACASGGMADVGERVACASRGMAKVADSKFRCQRRHGESGRASGVRYRWHRSM